MRAAPRPDLGEQTDATPYRCLGGCGLWVAAPLTCLWCWYDEHTYDPRTVGMLPPDDPRRLRVRDPRGRWRPTRPRG